MKQKRFKQATAYRYKRFTRKSYSVFNSMHRVINIGVIAGCMLSFAHLKSTSAQPIMKLNDSEEIEEMSIEEVTVTATRVELSLNQSARLVTVITKQEIQQLPVQSIQDLLNYSASIDVVQRSGHGVQADISIRGGSYDQTAILLNGINLSSPHTGHYSFGIPINLSDIERIEIIHGPSSITYGASAFSGGINIITEKDPDYKAYAKVEAGSHNLYGVEAHGVLKKSSTTTQLSAGYNKSDGYRENKDYEILNILSQTRFRTDISNIDVQLGYNDKKYGANSFYSPLYPNQYDKTSTSLASIQGNIRNGNLKFIPSVYWTRHYNSSNYSKRAPQIYPIGMWDTIIIELIHMGLI